MRKITVNSDFTLPVRSEKQIASNVLKGSLGNLIEWFDWYVYASFAIYFSGAFFPAHNPTAQLLAAAGVFAIGFFMRPLGSLIMGRLADRHGRRTALTISVLIMATGSLIIAFVPTYATIGIWSPLILIATRLLQGLSLGGEYGTSATYLSEMASPHHRGFYASFQYVTLIAGQLFALLVQIVLQNYYTNAQLTAFGWRIPFGIGAIGALVVLWLRLSMEESDQFTRHNQHQTKAGTLRLLMRYPKQIVIVIMMTLGGTICFYTYTTYLQQFPHTFVPQCQFKSSKSPSPLVFLLISTHFTATLGIPLTSPVLQPYSFQSSSAVEPRAFTSDLQCRLRSLYTQ